MSGDRDPRLIWTEAGEPRSGRFDDVYFSAEDGLSESRAVFLAGCGLPEAWGGRDRFTVAELGFGTGLNIVALLDLWHRERPTGARLTVFSIEAFPLDVDQARRALARWPDVAGITEVLLARWPPATPGFHRIDLQEFAAVIDLAIGDAAWALNQWSGHADAWFLDGFAPAANPQMWSDAVMDAIAARSAPDARLATFTVAGAVRRGLADRGFAVDKRPGHGRKRERLEARLFGSATISDTCPTVAVIGAGIAGAAVVRALKAEGLRPIVIETDTPGAGASGFPAALVTPRFDLGDDAVAALFAQSLERARDLYRRVPEAVIAESVRQHPASERDVGRFARIAGQPLWAPGALIPEEDGALAMTGALTVHPAAILNAWLDGVERLNWRVSEIRAASDGWRVVGSEGQATEVDHVVMAAGWGTAALAPWLALSPVRGQADWVEGAQPTAEAWGGYVAPTRDGFLFGATHDRGDIGTEARPADTERNLATLGTRAPTLADLAAKGRGEARAAVRATTRDRLPVAGAVPDRNGLFVLGGLGSRGFCLSPLLAEHIAALISGSPSPLPQAVAARVSPARAGMLWTQEP
jgi:tRNA 5-methylaminomethyl-2-thiouridine biosynthesis bifunctional protein